MKHYFPGKVYATVIPRTCASARRPATASPSPPCDRTSRGGGLHRLCGGVFEKKRLILWKGAFPWHPKTLRPRQGLGALLGDDVLKAESTGSLYLPISQVESCSSQPRKHFDEASLAELADSIREHGIIQPLTVRKLASGYYQIIAGERRWRAARLAGLQEVPVIVMEADDRKAAELAMIENLQREDLNPMEEAAGFQSLMETYHMTQEEAASRVWQIPQRRGQRAAAAVPDAAGGQAGGGGKALRRSRPGAAAPLPRPAGKRRWRRDLRRPLCPPDGGPGQAAESGKAGKSPRAEGNRLCRGGAEGVEPKLGRGVRIVTGRKKGRIELEYYGIDDLNDLLEALAMLRAKQTKTP